jgi:MFS family permease
MTAGTAEVAVAAPARTAPYAWWLLGSAVLAVAVASGMSFWAYGLYVAPLESEFGWSRATVSLAWSIALGTGGLAGPLVGWWIDRRGARSALLWGALATAGSCALIATTQTLWQWYALWAVNGVVRQLMVFMPFMTLITRWFDARRGMAVSILGSGFSLGGFVVLPLMELLVEEAGWRGSFVVTGVTILLVHVPLALFVVRDPGAGGAARDRDAAGAVLEGVPLREALRSPLFWALAGGLTAFFFGAFAWLVHQVPYYESVGISAREAARIVAVGAGCSVVVRLLLGLVIDRVGQFEVLAAAVAGCFGLAMCTLLVSSEPVAIAVFVALWVAGMSGGPTIEALLLTRAFGLRHFASILGAVFVLETAGQIVSPTLAGAIFDASGSYDAALVLFAGSAGLAAALFLLAGWLRVRAARVSA